MMTRTFSRHPRIVVPLVLVAATAAAHGWALWDGLFLDDHWHRLQLQSDDWSLSALLNATTIIPERFIDTWWQETSLQWWYVRPFSMLVAKFVYHVSNGSVMALHGISLSLHLVGSFMVYALAWQLTRRRLWSLVGALLFIVHSHSVYAVGWLAAQNAVLQTVLMLAALLCYIRASGLTLYPWSSGERVDPSFLREQVPSIQWPPCLTSIGLWGLALLSRENAIVFPVFMVAFDLAFGGWRHVRKRTNLYAVVALVGIAFILWRLAYFYHPMPDFYVRRPDGPGYLLWCLAKLMHYTTATIWLSPMTVGPTGRFDPFREVPGDCALMFAILAIMSTGYYLACRRAPGYWIWPLWIFLALLPVIPITATPHTGYMPSVGFAIAMILGPALRDKIRPISIGRWSPGIATWFLIATITYIPIYRTMWYSLLAAERFTVAGVAASRPPPQAKDLFFINLPFANIYAQLHLDEILRPDGTGQRGQTAVGSLPPTSTQTHTRREADFDPRRRVAWADFDPQESKSTRVHRSVEVRTGKLRSSLASPAHATRFENASAKSPPLRCHVLTYSPGLLRVEEQCRLEQLDAYCFTVAIEGRGYFSGALGRFLIEAMRTGGRMHTGDVIRGDLLDVEILKADGDGVRKLLFRFHEPLASQRYCFYVTTHQHGAARVKFWGPEAIAGTEPTITGTITADDVHRAIRRFEAGEARAADVLFAAATAPDEALRTEAREALDRLARPVAAALAAPIQGTFDAADPNGEEWAEARQWWRRFVDDETLQGLWRDHEKFAALRRGRDRLFTIRGIAAHIIRTDLYLTGPPFPSPR